MAVHSRIEILEKFLDHPHQIMNVNSENQNISMFFTTLLGDLFIQGYRVFETINSHTLILSLMQYSLNPPPSDNLIDNLPQYKIVNFEMEVIIDKTKRGQIFKNLLETAQCIDSTVQINIIYLKRQKLSVMNKSQLEQSRQPDSKPFFKPARFLPEKRGYKHIDVKTQGTRLHGSIEYFLKGHGMIRNLSAFKRDITGNQQEIKFEYDLNKVMNSLRMIIGKQVFANDYWIMNAEKWMRKKTAKKFKRFDLILRNQNKICIIDWKFSKNKADQKINKRGFVNKNRLYLELAKKDYKAQVELKFYCIHSESVNDHYHKWTEASYDYKIAEVMLDNDQEEQPGDDSSEEIQFYDDRQTLQKIHEQGSFIQVAKTQEKSLQCLREFRQKRGIQEPKPKTQIWPKIKETSTTNDKYEGVFSSTASDQEYNPSKKIEKENKQNQEVRRGKRSKPVEWIEPEVRNRSLDQRKKRVKQNESNLKDEVISISSKGEKFQEMDEIEILPSEELQSMKLRDQKKVRPRTMHFDPRQIDKLSQNRYLTLIQMPSPQERTDFQNFGSVFDNDQWNNQTKSVGKNVIDKVNNKTDFQLERHLPKNHYDEELLQCFEDEEEDEEGDENIRPLFIINEEKPLNPQSPRIISKHAQIIQAFNILEENPSQQLQIEGTRQPVDNKKTNSKARLNTEALKRSYEREQEEKRKKKLCNPKHYFYIPDSDDDDKMF